MVLQLHQSTVLEDFITAEPDRLYLATDGYEAHEFRRTVSRLIEMRSADYLALPHGARGSGSGDTGGIVET